MTTRTWNSSTGNFTDAGSWSPAGAPVSGDIAIINAGTVAVSSSPDGVTIQLNEPSGTAVATTLALNNVTLSSSVTLITNGQNAYNAVAPTISVTGTSAFAGAESFYGTKATFAISAGSTLLNTGTLNFYSAGLLTIGGGILSNAGTIALVNPGGLAQYSVFNDAVTGSGTIAMGKNARIELSSSVAAGQTILLNDGAAGNQIVQIDQLGAFAGTINGFSSSDLLAVTNISYTNALYTSTTANSGTLSLFNGGTLQGSINFSGQYTLGSFNFTYNNFGAGLSNLQITTTAVNAQTGGLPSGYQNGGNGASPVYRFFDNKFGTHFFTADVGEKNTVIATRSADLIGETNGFGAVSQADPNATPVYRFFDNKFGTHFFTASATERDQVASARAADLVYEPSSTFFEHASQQAGDVAVYRFFDTKFGTHFYTGDQGEYNGIVTPGSSTFRADLTFEKIEFYAPAGSFA